MFTGSDQIEIFPFYFIHHGIHFRETHHTGHYIASDHKRRHTVGKSPVDHKIPGIGDHRGVQSGDIAHQIVETISGNPSGTVQIDPIETFHDLCVIRNLKIRHHRFPIALYLYILTVVFSDRHAGIDDIRDGHHDLRNFLIACFFLFLKPVSYTHLDVYKRQALDLTEVHNLTDAEKGALAYLVWTQFGYEAFQSSWDELCEQGYIDKDRLSFEDGILITLTDTPVKGSSFDFTVKKWRGGDGAIGYDDCKAKKAGPEWGYTLDGAWTVSYTHLDVYKRQLL